MTRVSGTMEHAERWFVRLMATDCTPEERAAFERWRNADERNARAYAVTENLWAKLESIDNDRVIGAYAAAALRQEPSEAAAAVSTPAAKSKSRWYVHAAIAAGVLLAVAVALLLRPELGSRVGSGDYLTATEQRTLNLTDGSSIELDVDTQLVIRFTERARGIELLKGRAIFDVAADPSRPFRVNAGGGCVTALGTRFQIDRTGRDVKVVLTDGAIVVQQSTEQIRLSPGEEVRYLPAAKAVLAKRTVDPEPAVSWAQGYHVFRDTPLQEALIEINRYASLKVRFQDESLAQLPVSGSFKTGDSASIATALPSVLPVRVEQTGNEIVLVPR